MILSLFIGLRFSHSKLRSEMLPLISIISILGIALGVTVLIVGLSAMNGFEYELKNRILEMIPHGEIETIHQPWDNWNDELTKIQKVPGIAKATPYISFTALLENRTNMRTIQVRGIDPKQEMRFGTLAKFIEHNTWENFTVRKHSIIIGGGVATALQIKQGDWVSILLPPPRSLLHNNHKKVQQFRRMRLHVAGILQARSKLDYNFALIPLKSAQTYLDMGNNIDGIAIKVTDVFSINKLLRDAREAMNNHYVYTKSWIHSYGHIHRDIQIIRTIICLAMVLLISVACFNIISTLSIAVKRKSIDIAILRTLGTKDSCIRAIFLWYGLLDGLCGSFLGAVFGVLVSLKLTSIINRFEKMINHQFLSSNIYFIDFFPSKLHWQDVISVLLVAILISLLSTWYPAIRAVSIDPARILNHH